MRVLGGLLAALVAVDCASAAATPRAQPHAHVPLRRRRAALSKRMDTARLANMANRVKSKYGTAATVSRRATSAAVTITNEDSDSSYSGTLQIGSSGESFDVILDTGSSDLWVASSNCRQGCQDVSNAFDSSSSSSFQSTNQELTINYGSGSVSGVTGSDTVSIAGFTVKSQTFVSATQLSSNLVDDGVSGLLGLGFKAIASTGATPLVQSLASDSSLSDPLMAFFLARDPDDSSSSSSSSSGQSTSPGGFMTIGATNSSLFTGDIDFVNIPSSITPGFWMLPMAGITIGGNAVSLPSQSSMAAIDTGTTLIGGPSAAVAAVYSNVNGAQQGSGDLEGFWTFPCSNQMQVSMSFGGTKSWPISSNDFQLQAQDNNGDIICVGAIFDAGTSEQSTSTSPSWIIGDTFLKNVYSVFRFSPASVGFAQLSSSAGGSSASTGTPTASGSTSGPSLLSSLTSFPSSSIPLPIPVSSEISSLITSTFTATPSADGSSPSANSGTARLSAAPTLLMLAWVVFGGLWVL